MMYLPKHKLCFYARRSNGRRSGATYLTVYRNMERQKDKEMPLPLRRTYLDSRGQIVKENW